MEYGGGAGRPEKQAHPAMVTNDGPDHEELERLANRAAGGEHTAFARLVDATHRRVFQLAMRALGHTGPGGTQEAEEVLQETYIRVWQGLANLRDRRAVLAWICSIARHVALDRLRQRGRDRSDSFEGGAGGGDQDGGRRPLSEQLPSDEPSPDQQLGDAELGRQVQQAILELKEKHRTVLMLREIDGLSYEEIAQALDISIGTVESRIFRAREALAKKLRKLGRELSLHGAASSPTAPEPVTGGKKQRGVS
jgi:RNA polymerase sigma-70 factor (ECF subfamily)